MKNKFIYFIICMSMQTILSGQTGWDSTTTNRKLPLSSTFDAGYMFGGQFYNDHFLYNPGVSFSFSERYRISNNFEAGIGLGYITLTNEAFVPFYFNVLGYKKKSKNTGLIEFRIGRTAAWYSADDFPSEYSLMGGVYFLAGLGRKIQISEHLSMLFKASLTHLASKINYEAYGGISHSSQASYDILQLSFGIIYH